MFSSLFVCLSVCLLATLSKNLQTDMHELLREGWQWAVEHMIKFWWRSGSPSEYRDCFPGSSLLGDTESGINRMSCARMQCTSRHRHGNYDISIYTSPAHDRHPRPTCLGGGMHCPSDYFFFPHLIS